MATITRGFRVLCQDPYPSLPMRGQETNVVIVSPSKKSRTIRPRSSEINRAPLWDRVQANAANFDENWNPKSQTNLSNQPLNIANTQTIMNPSGLENFRNVQTSKLCQRRFININLI